MSKTRAIASRELRGFFRTPAAYVIIAFFLLLGGLFFDYHVTFYALQSLQASSRPPGAEPLLLTDGVVRPLVGSLGFLVLFTLPLVTMRLIADERRSGALELLTSYPVRPSEIVLGKFAGAFLFYVAMLAPTAVYPVALAFVARPDPGVFVAAYAGLLLLGGAFLALGVLLSALTSRVVVGAAATFGLFLLVWTAGFGASAAGPRLGGFLERVSFLHRLGRFAAGAIDLGDVYFFVAVALFALYAATGVVASRRWRA